MRVVVNPALDPPAVAPPSADARAYHASLPGYAPTPLRALPALAGELGLGAVALKDESDRLGLPAFKVLGASWAVERALRERPGVHTLVAASAGNHGRAVAHVAALRGLAARILLPARSAPARRAAIAAEGAELVVVDGDYEDAVRQAAAEGARDGCLEVADVGDSGPAHWVVDGYATLFAELGEPFDVVLVPTGVGSLAAAAARYGAAAGAAVIAVEPVAAACLSASLAAGAPTRGGDAGHRHGRARLRRGLGGRVAGPARRDRRRRHGRRCRGARRDARARRARAGDRRLRRRRARRAARAGDRRGRRAAPRGGRARPGEPRPARSPPRARRTPTPTRAASAPRAPPETPIRR